MRTNKRGYTTLSLIIIIILAMVLVMVIGVGVYVFDIVDQSFNQIDFTIGNVSFNETYQTSLGLGINTMQTTFPQIVSLGTLLGMVVVMVIIGFLSPKIGRLWIVFDFLVLIGAEMIAVVVSSSFESFINSSPEFLVIYSTTLSAPSTFILTLPVTLPAIGALIMISTYILNRNFAKPEGGGF